MPCYFLKYLCILLSCSQLILSEKLKNQQILLDSHQKILEVVANIAKLHQLENVEITSDSEQEAIERILNYIQSLLDESELKASEMNNQIENEIKVQQEIIQSSINEIQQSDSNIFDFIKLLKNSENEQKELEKRLDLYKSKVTIMNSKKEFIENQQNKEDKQMEDAISAVESALPLLMKILDAEEEAKAKRSSEGFLTVQNQQGSNDLETQIQNDIFPLFQTSCSNPVMKQIFQSSLMGADKKINEETVKKLVFQIKSIKERFTDNLRESKHRFQQQKEEIENELKANEQVYEETLAYSNGKSKTQIESWKQKIQELELNKKGLNQNKEAANIKLQSLDKTLKNLNSQQMINNNKLKEEISILKECDKELKKL